MSNNNLLPNVRNYLNDYLKANWSKIQEASYNLRPNRGYPEFHRSEELYQFIFDISSNMREKMNVLDIPEGFPSPKALLHFIRSFKQFIETKKDLLEDIISKYDNKDLPFPVIIVEEISNELIDVFNYVLELKESKEILESQNKEQNLTKEITDKVVIGKKNANDPIEVLKNFDLDELSISQIWTLLKLRHVIAVVSSFITMLVFGYLVGQFTTNVINSINTLDDKRKLASQEDSVKYYKLKYMEKNLQNNILSDSLTFYLKKTK